MAKYISYTDHYKEFFSRVKSVKDTLLLAPPTSKAFMWRKCKRKDLCPDPIA